MFCPFCQQWNPRGDQRCTFCDNRLDDDQDTTVDGRPSYERHAGVTLPEAGPDRYAPPELPVDLTALLDRLPVKVTLQQLRVVGVALALLVFFAWIKC